MQEQQTQELVDDEYPQTKSGVRNAREKALVSNARPCLRYKLSTDERQQNAKYQKNDTVHMSVIANGTRSKGVFKIYNLVYNPAGWVEYQLLDVYTGQLHECGKGFRERDLKLGT